MCSTLMQSMAVSTAPGLPIRRPGPGGIGEVDALRRAQVCEPRVPPPGLDAGEMRRVDIARPPGQLRRAAGEGRDVLPGAAAELQHVAGPRAQKARHRRPDGIMVAVESRTIQPAVGCGRLADFPNSTTNSAMTATGLSALRGAINRCPPARSNADYRACYGITQAAFVVFIRAIGQYRAFSGQTRDPFDVVGLRTGFKKNLGG